MADLDEAGGEHMQQKTPDKLDGVQRHLFHLVVVFGVAPAEADAPLFQTKQAAIGNGHAVGVSRQIAKHLLWAAKRRLDMCHPVLLFQRLDPVVEADRVSHFADRPEKAEFAL